MTSLEKSSRSHHGLYLYPIKEWLSEMVDLGSRVIGSGTITNSEKSTMSLTIGFSSRVKSKLKNLILHFFLLIKCEFKRGGTISKSIDAWINVG